MATLDDLYTPQQWLDDFSSYARSKASHGSAESAGEWSLLHFATKYPKDSEFRRVRFEAAVSWLEQNIEAVNQVDSGNSVRGLTVSLSTVRMLYPIFAVDHGLWPLPRIGLDYCLNLLREQIAYDEENHL